VLASALGALGGVGTGLGIYVSLRRRWLWLLVILVLLLGCMLIALGGDTLLPSAVAQRFSDFVPYIRMPSARGMHVTDENFAIVERLAHWEAAIGMLEDHPVLGVGIGNYVATYPAYALPGWRDALGHAHNYYLHVAAEMGLLGLAAYLLLMGMLFRHGWSAVRSLRDAYQGVALGILGILAAFATHSLFDNLYVHGMNMHLAILLGLLFVLRRRREVSVVETT
jgi:O-antigen ligase